MNLYEMVDVRKYTDLIDDKSFMAYCPICERETTFERSEYYKDKIIGVKSKLFFDNVDESAEMDYWIADMFNVDNEKCCSLFIQEYECCVNREHKKYNIYHKYEDKIIKIGQYPSEIDNGSNQYLDKVKKICTNKEAKEIVKYIKTALTMESYGYGIASLLYMRRAFEKLISISEGNEELENTSEKMKERIKRNQYLPDVIKKNARVYNVISEGIHNQTEEECMELFKVIKAGVIILIGKTYAHVEEERTLAELGITLSKL